MEIPATAFPEKTTPELSAAHQPPMILGDYCEITAPVAQDHGVLAGRRPGDRVEAHGSSVAV